jgi:hypothetical protein
MNIMNRIHSQSSLSMISFPFIVQCARKIRIFQAGICLGLAIPLWLTTEAIAPQIVKAYTARVDLAITRLPEENYQTILRRAETVARAAAQRSFDQDILVTEVSIMVTAQNKGMIAPVLTLEVSRDEWKKRPDPRRWASYYTTARWLLLFEELPKPQETDPEAKEPDTAEPNNSDTPPGQPPQQPTNSPTPVLN